MGGTKTNAAPRGEDALPDMSGEDEVPSEATKVGDGRVALEEAVRASLGGTIPPISGPSPENATSKMAPFQLKEVLERLAETPADSPPEKSQARMKAPSQHPPVVHERATVPGHVPLPAPAPPRAEPQHVEPRVEPQPAGGIATVMTMFVAVVFIALVCAVLLAR